MAFLNKTVKFDFRMLCTTVYSTLQEMKGEK